MMSLADRLMELMTERGINRAELAKGAGLPYTTVVAIFENGGDNTKLSTMRKLADFFGITLDELVIGERTENVSSQQGDLTEEEIITLAAHQVGHEGALTPEQLAQIKLAMKIALAKEKDK